MPSVLPLLPGLWPPQCPPRYPPHPPPNTPSRTLQVGVNVTHGTMFHVGYGAGSITVDKARNEAAYGKDFRKASALLMPGSKVQAPRELQPLYGMLNACINTVERVSSPGRMSASLERMTAGGAGGARPCLRASCGCLGRVSVDEAAASPPSPDAVSAGRDPDRHMVLPDGVTINEELNEPPKEPSE